MSRILFAQDGLVRWDAPVNTQALVQNADASIGFRMIEVVALVLKYRRFAQHRKAVSKSLRDEELTVIVLRQLYSHMLTVRGTAFTDIHRYVQHGSFHTTHQLALRVRRTLEVQAAHHAIT